jgi:hypothetical protein
MEWVVIVGSAALVVFVAVRLIDGLGLDRAAPVGPAPLAAAAFAPGMSVRLSVLPTRTALVVLDAEPDAPSAAVAGLVEEAVRDALVIDAVDVVEVRHRNGELLERRRRSGALSA